MLKKLPELLVVIAVGFSLLSCVSLGPTQAEIEAEQARNEEYRAWFYSLSPELQVEMRTKEIEANQRHSAATLGYLGQIHGRSMFGENFGKIEPMELPEMEPWAQPQPLTPIPTNCTTMDFGSGISQTSCN